MKCALCRAEISTETCEFCWYCLEEICRACHSEVGHCGHPEAVQHNLTAAFVGVARER